MQALHATDILADIALRGETLLNTYTSRLLLDAFHRMNLFIKPNQTHTLQQLHQHIKLADDHRLLFSALLDILERAGFVTHQYNQFTSTEAVSSPEIMKEIKSFKETGIHALTDETDIQDFINGNLKLVAVCLEALPDILTGQRNYMDVMFPMGDRSLVGDIYKSSIQQYLNNLVAETTVQLTKAALARHPAQKVQIIEIGAGTGGTTGPILAALESLSEEITYWYTDIAAGFTRVGRREFGNRYSFLEFKALDISKPIALQGFTEGHFDIVVCNNVLHATPDITTTLTHIYTLLGTGGQLIINDLTKRLDFNTVTFGLTKDWWAFTDTKHRTPFAPTLTYTQWNNLLIRTGFSGSQVAGIPGLASDEHHQSIITATRK